MKIKLTEEIWQEGNMFVAYCPELDISSCGKNISQAKKNLKETISINFEETKEMGTFEQFLQEAGFELKQDKTLSLRKKLIEFEPLTVTV